MIDEQHSDSAGLPLVEELREPPEVMAALRAVADLPGVLLLESALQREPVGRYSYLMADPVWFSTHGSVAFGTDPFADIRVLLDRYATSTVPGLPPFQGGAAGLLGYELGSAFERITPPWRDEFHLPRMAVGLYDRVLAWDHRQNRAWIISHGIQPGSSNDRTDRAAKRLEELRGRLALTARSTSLAGSSIAEVMTPPPPPVTADQLAPQYPLPGAQGVTSNFTRDAYLSAVERVIEYIHAGDIFQANLSQRLLAPLQDSPLELYARLRERNPAPFAAYFAVEDWVIASASPERFVAVSGGEVETRPIKGTRRRGHGPEADLFTRDELRQSDKDQAENVMIVDLLRNDLSRVCEPGTVRVPQLCGVETYQTVQHLVSEIRGRLQDGRSVWDLLAAVFPGGSITGAPKVRAMEIIAELEPTVRGPYCGSLFHAGFDGSLDSSILIRTFTCCRGWIQFPAGGGIVAQSDPAAEYAETIHKAEGMLRAL